MLDWILLKRKLKEKYLKDGKAVLKEVGAEFKFTKAVEY